MGGLVSDQRPHNLMKGRVAFVSLLSVSCITAFRIGIQARGITSAQHCCSKIMAYERSRADSWSDCWKELRSSRRTQKSSTLSILTANESKYFDELYIAKNEKEPSENDFQLQKGAIGKGKKTVDQADQIDGVHSYWFVDSC